MLLLLLLLPCAKVAGTRPRVFSLREPWQAPIVLLLRLHVTMVGAILQGRIAFLHRVAGVCPLLLLLRHKRRIIKARKL